MIDGLVLNFKAMFSARVKVTKKDFCIVLARKRQMCRDRAPFKLLRNEFLIRAGMQVSYKVSIGVRQALASD